MAALDPGIWQTHPDAIRMMKDTYSVGAKTT